MRSVDGEIGSNFSYIFQVTVKAAQEIQNIIIMKLNDEEQFPYYPRESYGDYEGRKVISVGLSENKEIQFEEGVIEEYESELMSEI